MHARLLLVHQRSMKQPQDTYRSSGEVSYTQIPAMSFPREGPTWLDWKLLNSLKSYVYAQIFRFECFWHLAFKHSWQSRQFLWSNVFDRKTLNAGLSYSASPLQWETSNSTGRQHVEKKTNPLVCAELILFHRQEGRRVHSPIHKSINYQSTNNYPLRGACLGLVFNCLTETSLQ